MSKNNQVYLNDEYNGDYTTISTGHIFYKKNSGIKGAKPVFFDDVKNYSEALNLLSQGIIVTDEDVDVKIGKDEPSEIIDTNNKGKGVKEKVSKKTVDENKKVLDELKEEEFND